MTSCIGVLMLHITFSKYDCIIVHKAYYLFTCTCVSINSGAPNRGGGWGVSTPPEFWMGGLNTCQPPLILRKKFLGGVGYP